MSDNIGDDFKALIARGGVTYDEVKGLRGNSWEWDALVPALTDEAFLQMLQHRLDNCSRVRMPPVTYDEAVIGVWTPELVRRYRACMGEVQDWREGKMWRKEGLHALKDAEAATPNPEATMGADMQGYGEAEYMRKQAEEAAAEKYKAVSHVEKDVTVYRVYRTPTTLADNSGPAMLYRTLDCTYYHQDDAKKRVAELTQTPGLLKEATVSYVPYKTAVLMVADREHYVVGERVYDHFVSHDEVKRRALAKLTPEERKALGL